MGSDPYIPPVPTAAALVGLGEDEYEILAKVVEKISHREGKKKVKAKTDDTGAPEEEEELGFFELLGSYFRKTLKNLPAYLRKNWIPLVVMAVLWIFMQVVAPYFIFRWGGFAVASYSVFGALTGSFGNFFGKAVFAGVFMGVVIPLFKAYRESGAKDLVAKYKKVSRMIRDTYKKLGKNSWKILSASAGMGLVIANLISGNNGFGTVFASILAAWALVNSLAFGMDGTFRAKMFKVVYRDVSGWFGGKQVPSLDTSHAIFAAFAAGLAGSIIPAILASPVTVINFFSASMLTVGLSAFLREFQSISGYFFGGLLIITALLLHLASQKKAPAAKGGN
jgi:hypothetical protein